MTMTASPSDVRTWARQQGLTSAERGPIPRSVLAAYRAAHAEEPPQELPPPAVEALAARLEHVEHRLEQALDRIEVLEGRASRSLLGLRLTL